MTKFKAIDIEIQSEKVLCTWCWLLWRADIWINEIPVLKLLIGCNIVVWLLMYWSLK